MLTDFGVQIAPSTYYAAIARPLSARAVRDEELKKEIKRVYVNRPGSDGGSVLSGGWRDGPVFEAPS